MSESNAGDVTLCCDPETLSNIIVETKEECPLAVETNKNDSSKVSNSFEDHTWKALDIMQSQSTMTPATETAADIDTVKINSENANDFELNSIATKSEEDPRTINNVSGSIEEKKSDSDFEDLMKLGNENDVLPLAESNRENYLNSSLTVFTMGNSSNKLPIKPKFKIKTPTELYPKSKKEKTTNFKLPQSRNVKKSNETRRTYTSKDLKKKDSKEDCKSKTIKHRKLIGQGTMMKPKKDQPDNTAPVKKIATKRTYTRKKDFTNPTKKPLNKKDMSKINETTKRCKTTKSSPTMPILSPHFPVENKLLSATKSRRFSCPDFKVIKNRIKKRSRKMSVSSLHDDIERIETRREAALIEAALMEAAQSFPNIFNNVSTKDMTPCSVVLEQCDIKKELKQLKEHKIKMLEKHCESAAHELAVLFRKKRGRPRKYCVGVKTPTEQNKNIVLKIKRVAAENVNKKIDKLSQKTTNKSTRSHKEIVEPSSAEHMPTRVAKKSVIVSKTFNTTLSANDLTTNGNYMDDEICIPNDTDIEENALRLANYMEQDDVDIFIDNNDNVSSQNLTLTLPPSMSPYFTAPFAQHSSSCKYRADGSACNCNSNVSKVYIGTPIHPIRNIKKILEQQRHMGVLDLSMKETPLDLSLRFHVTPASDYSDKGYGDSTSATPYHIQHSPLNIKKNSTNSAHITLQPFMHTDDYELNYEHSENEEEQQKDCGPALLNSSDSLTERNQIIYEQHNSPKDKIDNIIEEFPENGGTINYVDDYESISIFASSPESSPFSYGHKEHYNDPSECDKQEPQILKILNEHKVIKPTTSCIQKYKIPKKSNFTEKTTKTDTAVFPVECHIQFEKSRLSTKNVTNKNIETHISSIECPTKISNVNTKLDLQRPLVLEKRPLSLTEPKIKFSNTLALFGKPCVKFLNNQCFSRPDECSYEHSLPEFSVIRVKITNWEIEPLQHIYRTFVARYLQPFEKYFAMFCEIFGEKKCEEQLLLMLRDCLKYSLSYIKLVHSALITAGLSSIKALEKIIHKLPNPSFEIIDILIELMIETDLVCHFINVIDIFSVRPGFRFSSASHMNTLMEVALQATTPRLYRIVSRILNNLSSGSLNEVSVETMERFLHEALQNKINY